MEVYCDKCDYSHKRPVGRRCDIYQVRRATEGTENMATQDSSRDEEDFPLAQAGPSGPTEGDVSNASRNSTDDSLLLTGIRALGARMTNIDNELAKPHDTVTSCDYQTWGLFP